MPKTNPTDGNIVPLFSKKQPVAVPQIQREDMAAAVAATPPKESGFLANAMSDIEYLSDALPDDEQILSVAYCQAIQSGTGGVIALTPKRVVAVISRDDKKHAPAEPTVYIFPFQDLTNISFRTEISTFGYFDMKDQERVTLQIGWDKKWPEVFMNSVKQQYNRSKF
jgi:hypothetical protein